MPFSPRARLLLPVCALLFFPVLAHAAIGDNLATLRATYGSAKQVGGQMVFLYKGYSIAVYFDGLVSAMEIFVRDDRNQNKTDISPDDIKSILALEGGGRPWNPVQTHSGEPTWLTADGKLIARFNSTEKILVIMENAK